MFERFTNEARTAVTRAQEEARTLRDEQIGTEHILIGLAGDGTDPAAVALRGAGVTADEIRQRLRDSAANSLDSAALASLGINLDEVRRAAETRFGVGALDPRAGRPVPRGHLTLSPGAKKSLEFAVREAVRLRATGGSVAGGSISTGHLLIGEIDEGGAAVNVLQELQVDITALRASVLAQLAREAA